MKQRLSHFAAVTRLLPALLVLAPALFTSVFAGSPNFKDVCTSGCTYSDVQSAINAITDSGPTNVYTVFIDSGVLLSDTPITTNGKSYINFVGRGEGVSIVRASPTYFTNACAGSGAQIFFDLSDGTNGSTHVTLRGLTIDARTNDPGPGTCNPNVVNLNGVRLLNVDRILFDSAEVQAVDYGIWEANGVAGHLVEMYNSKVLSTTNGIAIQNSTWHIFSSDVKAVRTGSESSVDTISAVQFTGLINTTIWGSHLHAESSNPGLGAYVLGIRVSTSSTGSNLSVIGTQVHCKIGTANIGSSLDQMFAVDINTSSGTSRFDFVGSDLTYESPASMSQGRIGGLAYTRTTSTTVTINMVGGGVFDAGGSGGTYRADMFDLGTFGSGPTIQFAGTKVTSAVAPGGTFLSGAGAGFQTLNTRRGSVTLSGGTKNVTFSGTQTLPDGDYAVSVSTSANETIRVTNKSATGFTVTSSNGSSAASVDWILIR